MFDNLVFTETIEIIQAYSNLINAVPDKKRLTDWQIAELIDYPEEDNPLQTIVLAQWSDIAYNEFGSDYDRANVKYWAEYGTIVQVEDDYLNSGKAWIEIGDVSGVDSVQELLDALSDITDTMHNLNDYPVIDDEIHYNMLMADAIKAWDDYLAADIIYALKAQFHDAQSWFDVNETKLREFYYEFEGNSWIYETPLTIVNSNHREALDYALRKVMISR